MKFNRKIIGTVCVLLIISAAVWYYLYYGKTEPVANTNKGTEDKSVVITGSGTIKSASTFEVVPEVSGKITNVYFKEGDKVKANDLMFEIDSTNAQMNINKLSIALEQAKLALENDFIQLGYLNVAAPFDGQISNVLVKKGSVISQGAPVFTITDRSKVKLTVPFNYAQINKMKPGLKADVYINDINQIASGIVSYISTNSSSNTDQYAKLFNVDIIIDNPGVLREGQYANAVVKSDYGDISSPQNGVIRYADSVVVQSNSAGQVEYIDLKEDQFVTQGSILMGLSNNAVSAACQADRLKIQDIQVQLDYEQKQLEKYKIYAPIDGTISKQDKKAGRLASNEEVISSLADLDNMELVIDIDDSDIAYVKVGQKASARIDALGETSESPLELEVTKIPVEGSIANGVTTYPITLAISNMPNIKIGMNATIEIKIDRE